MSNWLPSPEGSIQHNFANISTTATSTERYILSSVKKCGHIWISQNLTRITFLYPALNAKTHIGTGPRRRNEVVLLANPSGSTCSGNNRNTHDGNDYAKGLINGL